jgi:hypothetical protein
MVTIKLYSGFEKRVQDNFLIEDHILTSISSDGQVAAVRIDRRFDTLRRVLSELCRSYTRLGAFEKAKQCEWYVRNIPIGYRAKKTYDMVAFEEESWQSIVAVG